MPKKLRKKKKNTYYPDMCFALLFPAVMAINLYGIRAFILFTTGILSALVFEYIGCKLTNHKFKIKGCQGIFTGGLLALLLPINAPVWLVVIGTAFSMLIVKTPFGGVRSAPFSCTAAGFAFLSICFPEKIFDYSLDGINSTFASSVSIAQTLKGSNPSVTAIELINAFIGTVPGAMGATSAAIMLGLLVYIIFKRPKSFLNSAGFLFVCFIGSVALTALNTNTFISENTFRVICIRMFSGFTMLMAVFFVTEDPLSPKKICTA